MKNFSNRPRRGRFLFLLTAALSILAVNGSISAKGITDLFPEEINYYLLVRDYPALKEEFPKSAYGKAILSQQMKPVLDAFGKIDDSPHFALAVPAQLDRGGLFKLVDGDLALFSTHYGAIEGLPSDQTHIDSIIAFEHDGKEEKIREFLEAQARVNGEPHTEEKDSVGDWEIIRKYVNFTSEVVIDVKVNPDWDYQNNPTAPYYLPVTHEFEYDLVYEYTVGKKWALFSEGANEPLARVLRNLDKKKGAFADSRLGRGVQERFNELGFSNKTPGVELYLNTAFVTSATDAGGVEAEVDDAFTKAFAENVPGFFFRYQTEEAASDYALLAPYDDSGSLGEVAGFMKPFNEKWFGIPAAEEGVFTYTTIDMEGLIRHILAEVEEDSPEFRNMRMQVQGGAMAATGLDMVEEVISRLGDGIITARAADSNVAANSGEEALPMELAIHLKDGSGLDAVLQQAYEKVLEQQEGVGEMLAVEELEGGRFYTLSIPSYSETGPVNKPYMSMGIVNDWLIVGPTQSSALRLGKRASELPEDGPLESKALRRRIRDLPKKAFFVSLSNGEKVTHSAIATALYGFAAMVPSSEHWYADNPFTKPLDEAFEKMGEDETALEPFELAKPYATFLRARDGWIEGHTTIKPAD